MTQHSRHKLALNWFSVLVGSALGFTACVGQNYTLGEDGSSGAGSSDNASGGKGIGGSVASGGSSSGGSGGSFCPSESCGDVPNFGSEYCEDGKLEIRCALDEKGVCAWQRSCGEMQSACDERGGICLPEGNSAPPNYTTNEAACTSPGEVCWVLLDTSGSGGEGGSGSELSCRFRRQQSECSKETDQVRCYTLEELNDPCSGTHLKSVDQTEPVDEEPNPTGAATENCPAPQDLVWGDEGARCGCFDTPQCVADASESAGRCCYPVVRSCRLC